MVTLVTLAYLSAQTSLASKMTGCVISIVYNDGDVKVTKVTSLYNRDEQKSYSKCTTCLVLRVDWLQQQKTTWCAAPVRQNQQSDAEKHLRTSQNRDLKDFLLIHSLPKPVILLICYITVSTKSFWVNVNA